RPGLEHPGVVADYLYAYDAALRSGGNRCERDTLFREIRRRAERLENCPRVDEIARRARPRAGGAGQPSQLEVTEGRLITLSQEIEHVHALPEVVIRLGRTPRRRVRTAAQPQELAPHAAHPQRLQRDADPLKAGLRLFDPPRREQRLCGDEIRLTRVSGRDVI